MGGEGHDSTGRQPEDQTPSTESRDPVDFRSVGSPHPRTDVAAHEGSNEVLANDTQPADAEEDAATHEVAQQVLAILKQENHLHLAEGLGVDEIVMLREHAPELYRIQLDALDRQSKEEAQARRAAWEVPAEYTRRGQMLGFSAVVLTLVLVGVALWMDHPWIAGVIGALDVVALAAVFASPSDPGEKSGN